MVRRNKAFSFVEIVIAIGILAFAMIPLMMSSQQSTRIQRYNIYRVTGTNLANATMERFKNLKYLDLEENFAHGEDKAKEIIENDPVLNTDGVSDEHREFINNFERSATFEDVPNNDNLGLLTVKVSWRPHPKQPRTTVELARVIVDWHEVGLSPMTATGDYAFSKVKGTPTDIGNMIDPEVMSNFWKDMGG